MRAVMKSRLLLIAYVACFFPPLLAMCLLYLNQNAALLALVKQKPGFIDVTGKYFFNMLWMQGVPAALLAAFIGPSLIAPDLINGALPVYLSRPISRAEYILGKGMVL